MSQNDDTRHVGPRGDAYQEAQKHVRERNDEARRVGKEERAEDERRAAQNRYDADKRDGVFR
jgi:hypothetical protein